MANCMAFITDFKFAFTIIFICNLFVPGHGIYGNTYLTCEDFPEPVCDVGVIIYLLPHPLNCSKYYICDGSNPEPLPRQCAEGQHFSIDMEACILIEMSNCNDYNCESTTEETTTTESTTEEITTPSKTTTECSTTPVLEPVCDVDFGYYLLPHPLFCRMYYICDGINPDSILRTCSEGQHFMKEVQACIPIEMSSCNDHNCESTTEQTTTPELTTEEITTPSATTTECSITMYYICDGSDPVPILRECHEGQHFSEDIQACIPIEMSNCNDYNCESTTEQINTSESTTEQITTIESTTEQVTTIKSTTEQITTPSETTTGCSTTPVSEPVCDVGVPIYLLPHPLFCSLYYICDGVDPEPLLRSCSEGQHFMKEVQACIPIELSHCNDYNCEPTTEQITTTEPTTEQITTTDSTRGEITTPSETTTGCSTTPVPESVCDVGVAYYLLPHPLFCSLYYICDGVDPEPLLRSCPEGEHFWELIQSCIFIEMSTCNDYNCESSTEQITTTESSTEQTTTPGSSTEQVTTIKSTTEHITTPSETTTECSTTPVPKPVCVVDVVPHLLPHPLFCRMYYICTGTDPKPLLRSCPEGLHFSEHIQACILIAMSTCRDFSCS